MQGETESSLQSLKRGILPSQCPRDKGPKKCEEFPAPPSNSISPSLWLSSMGAEDGVASFFCWPTLPIRYSLYLKRNENRNLLLNLLCSCKKDTSVNPDGRLTPRSGYWAAGLCLSPPPPRFCSPHHPISTTSHPHPPSCDADVGQGDGCTLITLGQWEHFTFCRRL